MSQPQVNVETECGDKVNDIDRAPDKVKHVWAGYEPVEQLQGEPSIADTLNVEESAISPVLIQGPCSCVMGGLDSEVVDDRDSHARMGLEAEGEDGGADEEDRDNSNTLD